MRISRGSRSMRRRRIAPKPYAGRNRPPTRGIAMALWPWCSVGLPHRQRRARGPSAGGKVVRRSRAPGIGRRDVRLSLMSRDGLGLPKDAHDAAGWMQQAAEHGHAQAQLELARMLIAGTGVAVRSPSGLRLGARGRKGRPRARAGARGLDGIRRRRRGAQPVGSNRLASDRR